MHERKYTIDELMDKTDNKYVLSEVISQRARELKRNFHPKKEEAREVVQDHDLTIDYNAINQAIEDLMEDRFAYEEKKKRVD